ncbi:MAG: type II CAAX prenyl endopeptidase Rce1 family protein [Candidatus Zhuqueibacterota bacterium]
MNQAAFQKWLPASLFGKDAGKTTIVLMLACLLPTIHRYFCSPGMERSFIAWRGDTSHAIGMFVSALALFGLAPMAVIWFWFRQPLSDYGIGIGQWRTWLPATMILYVIIAVAILYPASKSEAMRAFYPFDRSATDAVSFLRTQLLRGVFFYSAWEFLFRGFILRGLNDAVGEWTAICIQTIPSCLWHIGFPAAEIFSSIPAGILFGVLTIQSRSILWAFLLHWLIGFTLDFFIVLFP